MAVRKRRSDPARERRRQDPAVRWSQILSAARVCFAQEGFKGTTVDDIAAEAGVSVGLLYRVFGSKRAIVEAIILERVEEQTRQAYEIISTSARSGIDRAKVLDGLDSESLDLRTLALTFEMAAEACRDRALREFMQSRRAALRARLIDRLTGDGMDAKTAVEMISELDLIGAVASGAIIQSLASSKRTVFENIQTLLGALKPSGRKRSRK